MDGDGFFVFVFFFRKYIYLSIYLSIYHFLHPISFNSVSVRRVPYIIWKREEKTSAIVKKIFFKGDTLPDDMKIG